MPATVAALGYKERLARYDQVFPWWQALFRDDAGFPIDARYQQP